MWVGFCRAEVPPSPKRQAHVVKGGDPPAAVPVKLTVSGAEPEEGLAEAEIVRCRNNRTVAVP